MSKSNGTVRNQGRGIIRNDDSSEASFAPYLMRQQWLQSIIDPRRDIDRECGYPYMVIPKQYRFMYDREGIATRVVRIYPDECWAVDPEIYETDHHELTPFEEDWKNLLLSSENNPLHYCHRLDVLSGIGRYGILLLGINDGLDLSQPVPGINERGETVAVNKYKLTFMRPFDESMAHVINYERDITNPRFGKPVYYHVIFADVRVGEPGMAAAAVSVTSRVVHWTRVIHAADNRESSEVFGVPRMQPVFNRLCDVRKILGGSAEMFWKGGYPGYSIEVNPDLVTAGVTIDNASLQRQFSDYSNGLQRYLALVGMTAKSLDPQVANPEGNLEAQLMAIAIAIGCPLRIFTGSEQAQLASGQDVRTWNRRLSQRHNRYLTPWIVRPLVDRFVALGVMRPPKDPNYQVFWPDINMPSTDDQSKIADKEATAMMKYVTGGVYQVIPPMQWLTMFMGKTVEQAQIIIDAIPDLKNFTIKPPTVMVTE